MLANQDAKKELTNAKRRARYHKKMVFAAEVEKKAVMVEAENQVKERQNTRTRF